MNRAIKCPLDFMYWEKNLYQSPFQLLPNDTIYLFSDGYTDQFGAQRI